MSESTATGEPGRTGEPTRRWHSRRARAVLVASLVLLVAASGALVVRAVDPGGTRGEGAGPAVDVRASTGPDGAGPRLAGVPRWPNIAHASEWVPRANDLADDDDGVETRDRVYVARSRAGAEGVVAEPLPLVLVVPDPGVEPAQHRSLATEIARYGAVVLVPYDQLEVTDAVALAQRWAATSEVVRAGTLTIVATGAAVPGVADRLGAAGTGDTEATEVAGGVVGALTLDSLVLYAPPDGWTAELGAVPTLVVHPTGSGDVGYPSALLILGDASPLAVTEDGHDGPPEHLGGPPPGAQLDLLRSQARWIGAWVGAVAGDRPSQQLYEAAGPEQLRPAGASPWRGPAGPAPG